MSADFNGNCIISEDADGNKFVVQADEKIKVSSELMFSQDGIITSNGLKITIIDVEYLIVGVNHADNSFLCQRMEPWSPA